MRVNNAVVHTGGASQTGFLAPAAKVPAARLFSDVVQWLVCQASGLKMRFQGVDPRVAGREAHQQKAVRVSTVAGVQMDGPSI